MVVAHLVVASIVVTCVALGQWQLERLAQVRTSNALLAARTEAAPVDLMALLATLPEGSDRAEAVADLTFRRVRATGTFRPQEEVLHRNRSLDGRQGFHVLTPLEIEDGTVVLVVRGWVPAELDEPPVAAAPPPVGRVTVTGILEASTPQPRFGARDPEEGRLLRVFHADTERLAGQVDGGLAPVVLRETTDGVRPRADDALPVRLGPPELSEANHRSYAVQWFVFAVVALVAYLALLRARLAT
jgi:surfeit locus 1 family protein